MSSSRRQYNDESDRFIQIDVRAWDSMDLYETRVYGHIKRRAGETSSCWESIRNIVIHTGIKRTKLLEVISSLIKKRLVRKEKGDSGSTDSYYITHPKDWKLPSDPSAKRTPPRSSDEHPPSAKRTPPRSSDEPKVDPYEVDPIKKNQDAREQNLNHPQSSALAAGDPLTREEPEEETIREEINNSHPLCHSESELSEDGKDSAACRTTLDNTGTVTAKPAWGDRYDSRKANRAKAKANSFYELGLKNDRWDDLQDFKKFEIYASEWVKNHPELVLGGKKEPDNPKAYLIGLLNRTAQCVDEGSKDLICWKNWQLEKQAFSPEFVAPEPVVVTTTTGETKIRIQKQLDALKAECDRQLTLRKSEERWGSDAA